MLMTMALALHLVEEVRTGFRLRFPLGEMPTPLFVGINVGIYTFALVMLALSMAHHPAHVPMAWLFSVAVALNGAAHLGIMAVRRSYFPGGLTAPILVVTSAIAISRLLTL